MLRLYNTLSKTVEVFKPLNPPQVKIYFCGPTVYDHMHVGHARAYVSADVLKRYLMFKGYDVLFVQNITDIDDKIIKKANDEGVSWDTIVSRYIEDYYDMLNKLNIKVHIHPRVTTHINEIISFIEELISKGYAYVAPSGSVYFNVDNYPYYGELSGKLDRSEWGQEEEFLSEKRKPYDFALWKSAKPGEPYWESPWGKGRPGWHIECSVMSSKYLGAQIDIHGGGQDLIFPHHENEKVQSEAKFGTRPWVNYWFHVGYLTIRKEKMSKSLGNVVFFKDIVKGIRPEVLRLWILSAHYRTPLEFSEEGLDIANKMYSRLVSAVNTLKRLLLEVEPINYLTDEDIKILRNISLLREHFHNAMDDDLNTPKAVSVVYELTTMVFRDLEPKPNYASVLKAFTLMKEFNEVLGILDQHIYSGPTDELINKLIDLLVKVRQRHRELKDYETSDWIRNELMKLGVKLMDFKDKSRWVIEL
ncbi:MAG: cysteine--tRNA ligase [Sulfolobales archaeon]|nr:cysteine--tRNA ligase [Sulfolobales archaeon]MCX8185870.1 cysteine--tRNA ligase [Sulfolobales archaeon]MDW7969127.1 cysteine--tRNA ligase [Sulfolobales archaeon]